MISRLATSFEPLYGVHHFTQHGQGTVVIQWLFEITSDRQNIYLPICYKTSAFVNLLYLQLEEPN